MFFFKLIIFAIPLLSILWWFWADRRLRSMGSNRKLRLVLSASVLLILGSFVWVILARRDIVQFPLPAQLYALVLLWGLVFLPLFALPIMIGWSILRIFKSSKRTSPSNVPRENWTRREWLSAAIVGLPALGTYAAAAASVPQMAKFRIREMTITLSDLPAELDGIRIAHITDIHVGKFTRGAVLDEIVAETNRLNADLVLFTGDLIDNTIRDLPAAVVMLQRIKASSGLYAIEGNHDLFDDPAEFVRGMLAGGINLLRNQVAAVTIRGVKVQLLGIVWHRGEAETDHAVEAVAKLRDSTAFPILLAHHPHAFDRAADLGIPLTFAGHTHGGQLMLNREIGAGPVMFRYWSGLYRKNECSLIVGNGTGNWFPMRVNAPAEIIHLTLKRA